MPCTIGNEKKKKSRSNGKLLMRCHNSSWISYMKKKKKLDREEDATC